MSSLTNNLQSKIDHINNNIKRLQYNIRRDKDKIDKAQFEARKLISSLYHIKYKQIKSL